MASVKKQSGSSTAVNDDTAEEIIEAEEDGVKDLMEAVESLKVVISSSFTQEGGKDFVNDEALQEEDEKEEATYLDALTGQPLEDDVLVFALPVAAPYRLVDWIWTGSISDLDFQSSSHSAVKNYKYKAKIVPGTSKPGKGESKGVEKLIADEDLLSLLFLS